MRPFFYDVFVLDLIPILFYNQ